jgi:hypothetical protein
MNDETLVIYERFHGKLFNKAQREPHQFLGSPARNGMRAATTRCNIQSWILTT